MAESETEFKFGTWYPIESAPRDGRPILAFRPKGSYPNDSLIEVVRWERLDYNTEPAWAFGDPDMDFRSGFFEPTHWMPLPPPPQSE